jgi:hypothetical protein
MIRLSAAAAIVIALVVSLFSTAARADELEARADATSAPRQNAITLGVLPLVVNQTVALEYERAVGERTGFFFSPSVVFGGADAGLTDSSVFGLGVNLGPRFYVTHQALKGLWLSPNVDLAHVSVSGRSTFGTFRSQATAFGLTGMLGFSWVFDSGIDLSAGLGGRAAFGSVELDSPNLKQQTSVEGFGPVVRVSAGWAF